MKNPNFIGTDSNAEVPEIEKIQKALGCGWMYLGIYPNSGPIHFDHEYYTKTKASWWICMQIWFFSKVTQIKKVLLFCHTLFIITVTLVIANAVSFLTVLLMFLALGLLYWLVLGYTKRVFWHRAAPEDLANSLSRQLNGSYVYPAWIKSFGNDIYKVLYVRPVGDGVEYRFIKCLTL